MGMASCKNCIHSGFCYLTIRDEGSPCEFVDKTNLAEVVRCKDCKHFGGHGACHYHAADENGTPIFVRENDFCSYGERRTNG